MDQGVQAFISFYNSSSRAVRQMVWLLLRAVSWLSRFTIGRRERRCVARRTRVRGGGEGDWPYVLNITYINCCCARTHAANGTRGCVCGTGDRARGKLVSSRLLYARATGAMAWPVRQRRHARAYACVSESGATSSHGPPTRASPNTLSARKYAPITPKRQTMRTFSIRNNSRKFVVYY